MDAVLQAIPMVAHALLFAALLFAALHVVTSANLVHSVLWLGVSLALTAVVFVLLRAPFLAAIQIILYTGGALTLMLFGVMLTQRIDGVVVPNESNGQTRGAVIAALLFGVIAGTVMRTRTLPNAAPVDVGARELGRSFLTTHLLAFEVLSILLLAAMVGAIVLARTKDPTPSAPTDPYPTGKGARR